MAFNPRAARRDERRRAEESGLASGVVNTAFMMGGALGLAMLASLAASRTDSLRGSGRRRARRAERRLPRGVPRRRDLRRRGGRRRRRVPADERARGWSGAGGSGCALLGRSKRESEMSRIIVSEFISLDGVIEDPGGAEGFEHGGWTFPYWSDEIGKFKGEELFASDAMLLGRITYEGFAAAWPSRTDEQGFAERMNSLPEVRRVDHAGGGGMAELHRREGRCRRGDREAERPARRRHPRGGQRPARADTRAARPRRRIPAPRLSRRRSPRSRGAASSSPRSRSFAGISTGRSSSTCGSSRVGTPPSSTTRRRA